MNADTGEPGVLPLIDVVDLKWLFAGVGVSLHVERLQRDAAYAQEMLARAAANWRPVSRLSPDQTSLGSLLSLWYRTQADTCARPPRLTSRTVTTVAPMSGLSVSES